MTDVQPDHVSAGRLGDSDPHRGAGRPATAPAPSCDPRRAARRSAARSSSPIAASPGIPRCSSSATPPPSRGRTASPCPGLCPVAIQQGKFAAATIRARPCRQASSPIHVSGTRGNWPSSAVGAAWPTSVRSTFTASSRGCAWILRPHLLPDRLPQPPRRPDRLGHLDVTYARGARVITGHHTD